MPIVIAYHQHIAHAWNYAEQMKPVGDPADRHHANMAGNIVKWWKHKILGGYKQFSGKNSTLFRFYIRTKCSHTSIGKRYVCMMCKVIVRA